MNFGHTIGHALEGITDFSKYAHGEAVIIGMYYETIMAKKMGIVDEEYAAEILNFLDGLGIDLNIDDYPVLELADWMLKDKKNVGGKISFILPVKEGMVKEQMLEKSGVLYYISSL